MHKRTFAIHCNGPWSPFWIATPAPALNAGIVHAEVIPCPWNLSEKEDAIPCRPVIAIAIRKKRNGIDSSTGKYGCLWHQGSTEIVYNGNQDSYGALCQQTTSATLGSTLSPTKVPTHSPTDMPNLSPTDAPTHSPTDIPTSSPTDAHSHRRM